MLWRLATILASLKVIESTNAKVLSLLALALACVVAPLRTALNGL